MSRRDDKRLAKAIEAAWVVEPTRKLAMRTGDFRCPDPRCGEDRIGVLVPHPKDETQTANRCPTCLATASTPPGRGTDA